MQIIYLRSGESFNMYYAGDLSPVECWQRLQVSGQDSFLIDVRTRPEWSFVGMVQQDEGMNPVILQEWQVYPTMTVESQFTTLLAEKIEELGGTNESNLHFICRSGVRSMYAAASMTEAGFANCFNIEGGFEGDPNEDGHRGLKNGWKAAGLPWRQS